MKRGWQAITGRCWDAAPPCVLRRFTARVVILLVLLGLASCDRHTPQAETETALRFWNGFTGPDGTTMERLVQSFEQETGIRVKMQIIPWDTYYDKLTLSLAYGGAPDVFICHANRIAEYARYGVLRPFMDLLQQAPAFPLADILPNLRAAASYGGKQVGIPLDCHPQGLYYNPRLFREAGIVDTRGRARPPRTLSEFLEAARRLTRDRGLQGRQWGYGFTWLRNNWITVISQHRGRILTSDLRRAALSALPAVEGTQLMCDLIERYRVAPKPDGTDAWLGFRQGRVAMAIEGIFMLSSLETQKGLEYAGAPVPRLGPVRAVSAGSHVMCLPRSLSPERVRLAWRFIQYLSDHSLDWAAGGQIPVRRSLLKSKRFQAMRVQSQFARQLPYVVFEPPSPKVTEIQPLYDAAVEAALLGIQTPQAALDEAARRINQVMERP